MLAFSEHAALHWPTKQIAALAALAAGGFYMVLTGMHVPIIRSFAMASPVHARRARGPARRFRCADSRSPPVVLMLAEPQEVVGVSFQMSFSAVLALIAGYEVLRPHLRALHGDGAGGGGSAPPGDAGADQRAGRHRLGPVRGVSFRPHPALFHAGQHGRGAADGDLGHAGRAHRAAADAARARAIGAHADGMGRRSDPWIARSDLGLAGGHARRAAHAGLGPGADGLGIAWLGIWRSPLRLAGVAAARAGLVSPLMIRPPDMLVSADARLIGLRTAEGMFVQQLQGADKFTLENPGSNTGPSANRLRWRRPATPSNARTSRVCYGRVPTRKPRCWSGAWSLCRGAGRRRSFSPRSRPEGFARALGPGSSTASPCGGKGHRRSGSTRTACAIVSDRAERGARPWVPVPVPRSQQEPGARMPVASDASKGRERPRPRPAPEVSRSEPAD